MILISLDTFRADVATPTLARIAAESVVFERAYAPIPFTLPSHMTLLTGLYPEGHGVTDDGRTLLASIATLPGLLRDAGYRTAGVHTSDWLKGGFGFDRGFDRYEQLAPGLTYADRVTAAALAAADAPGDARPPFLFVHYLDAHSDFGNRKGNPLPYYVPEPRRSDLAGALAASPFCDESVCATNFLLAVDRDARPLPPETVALARTLYTRGAEDLDAEVGRLADGLRARGLWDDAHVIIVSDHGEEFREHGMFLHSQPYEESVRIPFLWKLPGGQNGGRRVADAAALVDVLPTLAELLHIEHRGRVQGRSLVPLLVAKVPEAGPASILLQDKYDRTRMALVSDRHKIVSSLEPPADPAAAAAARPVELYDLTADPGETRNLAPGQPQLVLTMMEALRRKAREGRDLHEELARAAPPAGPSATPVLDDAARERLESIGYVQ